MLPLAVLKTHNLTDETGLPLSSLRAASIASVGAKSVELEHATKSVRGQMAAGCEMTIGSKKYYSRLISNAALGKVTVSLNRGLVASVSVGDPVSILPVTIHRRGFYQYDEGRERSSTGDLTDVARISFPDLSGVPIEIGDALELGQKRLTVSSATLANGTWKLVATNV